jgi:hypothetical protein
MAHGQYCKSGIASMKLKKTGNDDELAIPTLSDPEAKIAVCLTYD